jgi:capsular polysaccharide biosynthesis protein
MSTAEYVQRSDASWHPVEPSRRLTWPSARNFGSVAINFENQLPRSVPEFGIIEIPAGCVFGKHGWVLGKKNVLLPDLSWYGEPNERMRLPRMLRPCRLHGTCLSLASDWSSENYAHFLLDAIGRLALYRKLERSLPPVDWVYCPKPPSPAAATLLERLGIESAKTVWAEPGVFFRADLLLVPSCPVHALTYQPWLTRFLQGLVEGSGRPAVRRLYISRRGSTRQPRDEPDLREILEHRGFEHYEPTDHPSQPEDFDSAAVIVAAHGAGLANIAFCRPHTKVLELIPTDNAYPFYYSLAVAAGLDYAYVAGRSIGERPTGAFGPSPYDFELDIASLTTALDEWLEN